MSIKYDKFMTEVLPYVHDCPEIAAINAIRNAVIEFCEESKILQETLDSITLIPKLNNYDLDVADGYRPVGVMQAWSSNLPMTPKSADDLGRIYPQDWREMSGNPQYFMQYRPDELIVVPFSDTRRVGALRVIVAIAPTRDSQEVEDIVWQKYAETIGFGARSRLYDTPNQPYYDPNFAQLFRAKFMNGIGKAKIDATRSFTRAGTRVRPPQLV